VAWLLRFAGDQCAHVRIAVAKGLANHDDPRAIAALQRLAADADPKVRECADAIVCEFGQPG
jgi:HEAT repeat protein